MSDTETEELLLESFSNFVANNIPPTWWAERLEVKVVEWARSCKDQAIYVEVKAAFSKEVAIELVEKVLRFLTKAEVKTTGVTMANFEFNSHIKVLNGSVFKSFLKMDGVGEDDWKDEEKVEALRKGLREVLQKTLSENFDPTEEKVGTVDWSFNITYQPETFKIEILELDKDHVCVYILVSPGEGNLARVKQALKAAVTACLEENVWWDATSNMSSTVVGCKTHLPGFAFRLRDNFLLLVLRSSSAISWRISSISFIWAVDNSLLFLLAILCKTLFASSCLLLPIKVNHKQIFGTLFAINSIKFY